MLISFLRLSAVLSLLVVAHASALLPRGAPAVTVPLRRRDAAISKRMSPGAFATMAERVRHKYHRPTHTLNRRQGTGTAPITDENSDSSYSGDLTIGTSPQPFGVILDTGSSDLFVASTQCTRGCSQGVSLYDPTKSSTFSNANQDVSITYGSGAVNGQLASDTVSLGGFTVQSQTFVVATAVSQGLLDGTLSGLLGLGFKSIANTGATPMVEALASGSSFTQPLMSFYLERHINDQNQAQTASGGTFTLGDTNSSLFTGDIDYVNIPATVTPGFWLLPVTGITVQGSPVSLTSGSSSGSSSSPLLAAIDTGTTLIGGPSDAVAAVYAQIPGSQPGTGSLQTYFEIPCGTDVNLSFSFGGAKSWPINPVDFRLQAQDDSGAVVCIGAIFDVDGGPATPSSGPPQKRQSNPSLNPSWIIGDSFLKNVYSVFRFDPPSVGFAQLNPSLPGAGSAPGAAVNTGGPSPASSVAVTVTAQPSASADPSSSSTGTGSSGIPGSSSATTNARAVCLTLLFGLAGVIIGVLHIA